MKRIESFSVDHLKLLPGVYESRIDSAGADCPVTTYDVRITRPNFEPVMNTGEIHTIEHLGATYLRNREDIKDRVIYWGPMGCRTGFYFILAGRTPVPEINGLMKELFSFVAGFEGRIPGASPEECGNYSDMDLEGAKKRAEKYVEVLNGQREFTYQK